MDFQEFYGKVVEAILESQHPAMRKVLEPHLEGCLDRHPELRGRIRILVLEYAQTAKKPELLGVLRKYGVPEGCLDAAADAVLEALYPEQTGGQGGGQDG